MVFWWMHEVFDFDNKWDFVDITVTSIEKHDVWHHDFSLYDIIMSE